MTRKVVVVEHLSLDGVVQGPGRLTGDVPKAVGELKNEPGGNLVIMGSGQLIRSLLPHGLIDEFFLMIHPVVLGEGHRLFGPGDETELSLSSCTPTESGVLMATYTVGA